jgi:hypothetical protein
MTSQYHDPSETRRLCSQVLGEIRWTSPTVGYCPCPGPQQHPDCLVRFGSDGLPFAFCLHEKCREDVAQANRELRELCSSLVLEKPRISKREKQAHEDAAKMRHLSRLTRLRLLPKLLSQEVPTEFWLESSPYPVMNLEPKEQTRAFLSSLYPVSVPSRVTELGLYLEIRHLVWVGDLWETGEEYADHFRSVQDWLSGSRILGQQISNCTFKCGPFRRRDAVKARLFLTLESDNLTPAQFGAVVQYARKYLKLRSVVSTGGRSIHCSFDYLLHDELFAILEGLACDPLMLSSSLTMRLPGAERKNAEGVGTGRIQKLLYLDPIHSVTI